MVAALIDRKQAKPVEPFEVISRFLQVALAIAFNESGKTQQRKKIKVYADLKGPNRQAVDECVRDRLVLRFHYAGSWSSR